MKTSKKGFTLAEVLTTLMVIGVVAAMTIPTLINSTDDQQKKVAFKKAMSVLGQGAQLMVAKEVECKVQTSADLAACMNNVISGTRVSMEGATEDTGGGGGQVRNVIQTSDGMAYAFAYDTAGAKDYARTLTDICGGSGMFGSSENSWNGNTSKCIVVIDINGLSKGSREFKAGTENLAGKAVTDSLIEGSDQIPVLLTGEGVRPLYNSDNSIVSSGYKYMYGSEAKPDTDGGGDENDAENVTTGGNP